MIPNMSHVVEKTKNDFPRAWEKCHREGDPEAWDFIILAARRIYDLDQDFGLNGKRGGDDLSWDALNWRGRPSNVIDCVGRAGSTDPRYPPYVTWQVTNTTGKWFNPYEFNTYHSYSEGGEGGEGGGGEGGEEGGLTREQVQAMIDASLAPVVSRLNAAEARIAALESGTVKYGERLALESANGKILCADGGGPAEDFDPFNLVARSWIGEWESWKVHRG